MRCGPRGPPLRCLSAPSTCGLHRRATKTMGRLLHGKGGMVRNYELMAVLAPDIAEDAMPGALERITGYITTGGGEVTELTTTSPWGRRRLAYPIRDYR